MKKVIRSLIVISFCLLFSADRALQESAVEAVSNTGASTEALNEQASRGNRETVTDGGNTTNYHKDFIGPVYNNDTVAISMQVLSIQDEVDDVLEGAEKYFPVASVVAAVVLVIIMWHPTRNREKEDE